jgi:hypothetical protein
LVVIFGFKFVVACFARLGIGVFHGATMVTHRCLVNKNNKKMFDVAQFARNSHRMTLPHKVKTLPAGTVLRVKASNMTLVRWHTKNLRKITSVKSVRHNDRDLLLGEFYKGSK